MEETILRGEVLSRLITISKHYNSLLNNEFPSNGSKNLARLIIKIINRIKERYAQYSIGHIKHIGVLCVEFERYCGYLHESRLTNVPWSIVPAFSKLFEKVIPGNEFAICPIWESNFKISKDNILEILKEQVAAAPLLLFDFDKEKNSEAVREFFKEFPKGIYFVYFPKIEHLSSLHLALLGHEIGHVYGKRWVDENFPDFGIKQKLNEKYYEIAKQEYVRSGGFKPDEPMGIFTINSQTEYYLEISRDILRELVSDVFGTCIFGPSALIATYLFALKSNLDNTGDWEKGYLSWRYRLRFMKEGLDNTETVKKFKCNKKSENWDKSIEECVKTQTNDELGKNPYVSILLDAINQYKKDIFNKVTNDVGDQLFVEFIKDEQVITVNERLSKNIIPNAMKNGLEEKPIELRNILYGTWMFLFETISANPFDYEQRSRLINLLSIKAIELSSEQEDFNDTHKI